MPSQGKPNFFPVFFWRWALILCLAFSQAQLQCQASENLNRATTLYKAGKYTESLEFIEREIKENPRSAIAHYLFANVLLSRKAVPDAMREYQRAADLDPNGAYGQYSKQEIAKLTAAYGQVAPAQGAPQAQAAAPPAQVAPTTQAAPGQAPGPTGGDAEAMRHSVNSTSQQTKEKSSNTTDEFEAKLRGIKREADIKIAALTQEMNGLIAANGGSVVRMGIVYYDPTPQNDAITADYKQRIQVILDEAERRSDDVRKQHAEKQRLIEQSAVSVDRSLMAPSRAGDIKLVPRGTDLHVRNFETSDQPSGHVVPMVAEPERLKTGSPSPKSKKQESTKKTNPPSK